VATAQEQHGFWGHYAQEQQQGCHRSTRCHYFLGEAQHGFFSSCKLGSETNKDKGIAAARD